MLWPQIGDEGAIPHYFKKSHVVCFAGIFVTSVTIVLFISFFFVSVPSEELNMTVLNRHVWGWIGPLSLLPNSAILVLDGDGLEFYISISASIPVTRQLIQFTAQNNA